MRFSSSGDGEGFDALTIHMLIECFNEVGESGPHSHDGWVLSHLLNHCHNSGIGFTLVHVPYKGYYLKRGIAEGVIPDEMRVSFDL